MTGAEVRSFAKQFKKARIVSAREVKVRKNEQ